MALDFGMRRARAIEERGTGFTMQTNLKARPGSQGTLFQGGKPVAEHRWVRGYSPTRMAQVGGALTLGGGGIHVTAHPDAHDEEYSGLRHPHWNPFSEEHTKRLILEPLARSTYEAADVGRLAGGIHLRITPGTTLGEAAHYSPSNAAINVNRQVHKGDARTQLAKADAVLMHEMGHHVDISHNYAAYNRLLNTAYGGDMESGMRGRMEHNADAQMIENFRNDPRNQRRTNIDVRKLTYGGRGAGQLAGAGYTDPGAETPQERRTRLFDRKRQQHFEKTGEVATQSPLHPGQFKNDVQGVLF